MPPDGLWLFVNRSATLSGSFSSLASLSRHGARAHCPLDNANTTHITSSGCRCRKATWCHTYVWYVHTLDIFSLRGLHVCPPAHALFLSDFERSASDESTLSSSSHPSPHAPPHTHHHGTPYFFSRHDDASSSSALVLRACPILISPLPRVA